AAIGVRRLYLAARETERGEQVETGLVEPGSVETEPLGAEGLAERPLVEGELDIEGRGDRRLDRGDRGGVEAFFGERFVIDAGCAGKGAVTRCVTLDRRRLRLVVAERRQRLRHHAVDDLEI